MLKKLFFISLVILCFYAFAGLKEEFGRNRQGPTPTIREFSGIVAFGENRIAVEIADTEIERYQGLSNTEPLEPDTGMFFVFETSDKYGFWMKDMNYPIDIIWLDGQGRVVHVLADARPESYPEIFLPPEEALYVLEIPAGYAAEKGIAPGNLASICFDGAPENLCF